MEIKVKCPAKINLTLEILNKREDGFHNIQSVMQTIDLFDILTIKVEKSEKFEIKLSGTSDEIPYDERNLVHKAVLLFMKSLDPSPLAGEGGWKPDEGFKELMSKRAKCLRKKSTPPEEILWYYLRDRRFLDLKFRRQVPIENYIADFACFEKRLIIELDGSGHLQNKNLKYDQKRDDFLQNQNFKVLRFYNDDIFNNIEQVLELIYVNVADNLTTLNPLTPNPSLTINAIDKDLEPPHLNPLPRGERKTNYFENIKLGEESARQPKSINIHIEKNIPISAGLAGGSTDAAGVLWGLNKLLENPFSDEELHAICAQLGSDLNFCLEGGCQLATSRGEILEKLPFYEFELSLIKPKNVGISAKEAYTKFSQLKKKPNLNRTKELVEVLKSGEADVEDIDYSLHNDLELALIEDYEEFRAIKMEYPEAIMSGSGSTFFMLTHEFKDFDDTFWIKPNLKSIPYGVCEV